MKNNETILVTGGGGFLGCILTKKLIDSGYRVVILDNFLFGTHPLKFLLNLNKNNNLSVIFGDIRNEDELKRALHGVNAVIHLAAIVGDPICAAHAELAVDVNFNATIKLGSLCKSKGIQKFIFASTCSVYGESGDEILTENSKVNPISLYAETRFYAENGILSLADQQFSPVILRLGTLFGLSPRMRFDIIINYFCLKAILDEKIKIFGGDQWRPVLHLEDASSGFLKVLEAPLDTVKNHIFNLASTNIKINGLGELFSSMFPNIEIELKENIKDKRSYRVSSEKIKKMLNFNPSKTIEEGIIEIKESIENKTIKDPTDKIYYNYYEF